MLGAFGPIVFEVSSEKILTPNRWSETHRARHAESAVLDKKPVLQHIGSDLSRVGFEIELNEWFCDPAQEFNKLKAVLDSGEAQTLNLGGWAIGDGPFVLEELTINREVMDNKGQLKAAKVNLNLKEQHP